MIQQPGVTQLMCDGDSCECAELETHRAPNILKEGRGCSTVSLTVPLCCSALTHSPYPSSHRMSLVKYSSSLSYMVMTSYVAVSNKAFSKVNTFQLINRRV